ncbi:cyclin-J-like [Arctopsyche grandis]|uniref:cyclin-J-like n=1 Tax=Arctopsyche grandis TaxID=121162 RepID=UPI00406D75F2
MASNEPWNPWLVDPTWAYGFNADPLHRVPSCGGDDWLKDYDKCFLEVLRKKESEKLPIKLSSPQLQYRGYLILQITNVSEELELGSNILHGAIQLLDHFMDTHDIKLDRLLSVTFTCLFISCKFELEGRNLPQFKQICETAKIEPIPNTLLLNLELSILRNNKWDLCSPNISTFLNFFSQFTISTNDQECWNKQISNWWTPKWTPDRCLRLQLKKKLNAYLSVTLLDVKLTQITPSLVAAACILSSRRALGLDSWPSHMQYLTTYSVTQIESIAMRLQKMLEKQTTLCKRRHSNISVYDDEDQGYATGKSSSEGSVGKRRKWDSVDTS